MGEDGRGSLEPGVASGDEFIMAYPLPFLEYYYFANRAERCRTPFAPRSFLLILSSLQLPVVSSPAVLPPLAMMLPTRTQRAAARARW